MILCFQWPQQLKIISMVDLFLDQVGRSYRSYFNRLANNVKLFPFPLLASWKPAILIWKFSLIVPPCVCNCDRLSTFPSVFRLLSFPFLSACLLLLSTTTVSLLSTIASFSYAIPENQTPKPQWLLLLGHILLLSHFRSFFFLLLLLSFLEISSLLSLIAFFLSNWQLASVCTLFGPCYACVCECVCVRLQPRRSAIFTQLSSPFDSYSNFSLVWKLFGFFLWS